VNVEPVIVAGFMLSLKFAMTAVVMSTPVDPLAGVTEVTVGTGGPAAVVNDQV
jgi:hypothetical protein